MIHCRGVESSLVAAWGAITLAGGVVAGIAGGGAVAGIAGGGVVAGAGGGIVTAAVIIVVSLVAAFEGVKQALEREAGQFKSTSTLVVVAITVGPSCIF